MDKMGISTRIHCEKMCVLNFERVNYQGVVENLSLTGALIKMRDTIPEGMKPGDNCGLMLCSNQTSCPVKYTCKVVRLDSALVAVKFLELNFFD